MIHLLTLMTDFGLEDSYVGVMQGVVLAIAPHSRIVDLTHQIFPQDRWAARFNLMNAVPYFPPGTVHVAVVDPGVGSQRRGIAIHLEQGETDCFLVGPDNGIFSGVLAAYRNQNATITAVSLTNSDYWRSPQPSATFHGRDIFAPVAAHLSAGADIAHLGDGINPADLVALDPPALQFHHDDHGNRIIGHIQHGDRFGNLITTIPATLITTSRWSLTLGAIAVSGGSTYGSVALGQPVALVGSHGWVELAVNGGSAAHYVLQRLASVQPSGEVGGDRAAVPCSPHAPLLLQPVTVTQSVPDSTA